MKRRIKEAISILDPKVETHSLKKALETFIIYYIFYLLPRNEVFYNIPNHQIVSKEEI